MRKVIQTEAKEVYTEPKIIVFELGSPDVLTRSFSVLEESAGDELAWEIFEGI